MLVGKQFHQKGRTFSFMQCSTFHQFFIICAFLFSRIFSAWCLAKGEFLKDRGFHSCTLFNMKLYMLRESLMFPLSWMYSPPHGTVHLSFIKENSCWRQSQTTLGWPQRLALKTRPLALLILGHLQCVPVVSIWPFRYSKKRLILVTHWVTHLSQTVLCQLI